MTENRILIPKIIETNAEALALSREPAPEHRELARIGARLVEQIAGDYFAALQAVAGTAEHIITSQLIATRNRQIPVGPKDTCIVRFASDNEANNPTKSSYWQPFGIGCGLEIAILHERTHEENPMGGWKWVARGVRLHSMRDAIGVRCLGGDSYRRMDDVLRDPGDTIKLTDNKILPLSVIDQVLTTCFTDNERSQSGGILQALINQANEHIQSHGVINPYREENY